MGADSRISRYPDICHLQFSQVPHERPLCRRLDHLGGFCSDRCSLAGRRDADGKSDRSSVGHEFHSPVHDGNSVPSELFPVYADEQNG